MEGRFHVGETTTGLFFIFFHGRVIFSVVALDVAFVADIAGIHRAVGQFGIADVIGSVPFVDTIPRYGFGKGRRC